MVWTRAVTAAGLGWWRPSRPRVSRSRSSRARSSLLARAVAAAWARAEGVHEHPPQGRDRVALAGAGQGYDVLADMSAAPPVGRLAGVTGGDVVDLEGLRQVLRGEDLDRDVVLRCWGDERDA